MNLFKRKNLFTDKKLTNEKYLEIENKWIEQTRLLEEKKPHLVIPTPVQGIVYGDITLGISGGYEGEVYKYAGGWSDSGSSRSSYVVDYGKQTQKLLCLYCGQTFIFDEKLVKTPTYTLSCPCCGGTV